MGLGGIIAGALSGGAKAVGGMADDQMALRDKKDYSTFQAQLETEKATAIARLQQTMAREYKLWEVDQTPGGYADLARKSAVADEKAKALGAADPDVLKAGAAVEDNKAHKLNPGDKVVRGKDVVSSNDSPTMAEVYQGWGSKGGPNATTKKDRFDEKQVIDGRKGLLDQVNKTFLDPVSQKPIAAVGDVALQAYNAFIDADIDPATAQQRAYSAVNKITAEAEQIMRSPKFKGQNLDLNKAIGIAMQLRQQKLEAGGGPAPAPAPAKDAPVKEPPVNDAPKGVIDGAQKWDRNPTKEQIAEDQKKSQKERSEARADKDRESARANRALAIEAQEYTPEKIRTLKPKAAREVLDKFGPVLTPEQQRALRIQT